MHPQAATRELTLKERTTEDLESRLTFLCLYRPWLPKAATTAEIEAIEVELEERSEYEQKVSRW